MSTTVWGVEAAAEILPTTILRGLVDGSEGDFHQAVRDIGDVLHGAVEVGGKILLRGRLEPMGKRAVVGGMVVACCLALKWDGGEDDDDIAEAAIYLVKELLTNQVLALQKKAGKETVLKVLSHITKAIHRWIPSPRTFSLTKWLTRNFPAELVVATPLPYLKDNPEALSTLLAYYIVVTKGKISMETMKTLLSGRLHGVLDEPRLLHTVETALVECYGYKEAFGAGIVEVFHQHDHHEDVLSQVESLLNPGGDEDTRSTSRRETAIAKQTPNSHLFSEGKSLTATPPLSPQLRVVYLDNNSLKTVDGGWEALRVLTHLYLQNNVLEDISALSSLGSSLQKLYLTGNRLSSLRGIEPLRKLEELHLSRQQGTELQFDVDGSSVFRLLKKLRILTAADCGVASDSVLHLKEASGLEELDLSQNNISEVKEYLEGASSLKTLKVQGNPLCRQLKYRDIIVSAAPRLSLLDGHDVTTAERTYLHQIKQSRKAAPRPSQHGTPDLELTGVPPARTSSAQLLKRASDATPGF